MIIVILTAGCVLAVFGSDASPTGWAAVDALYRCAMVTLTGLAASRSRRWSLVIASGLVLVGTTTWMLIPPIGALGAASVLAWKNRRDRVLGSLIGVLVGWTSLNLVWPTTLGATAVLAALAVVPLWVSGYRIARSATRRRIKVAVAAYAILMMLGTAVTALVIATQQNVMRSAASETIKAAEGITGSTTSESAEGFDKAADRFESAARATSEPWALSARLVPVVSQNLEAINTAANAGSRVTRTAATIAESVDYDRLQRDGGGIDLAVLASFEQPVESAEEVITSVNEEIRALDSPWLIGPVRQNLDKFVDQTGPLQEGAEIAALVVNQMPAILGRDGERRYLMLLGNPAESRDFGGHIGSFAELRADNGVVEVIRVVGPYDLFGPGAATRPNLDVNRVTPSMLEMNPTRFPQNWGASPDMSVVADVARQLYPQAAGGSSIDGVIYADPHAFAGLLSAVGPIDLDASVTPATGTVRIDSDNAVEYLTQTQFLNDESGPDPTKVLVETALDRLTTNRLPAISKLIDAFGDVVDAGNLQFRSFRQDDEQLLTRTRLYVPFAQPTGGDLLTVLNSNAFASKIDAHLHRDIDYRLSWNPATGKVRAVVDVTLRNEASASGLPPLVTRSPQGSVPGTNRTVLAVVSPFQTDAVLIDGQPVPFGTRSESDDLRRHSTVVDVPPGQERNIRFDLVGSVDPGPDYHLRVYNQPLVNPDSATVSIRSEGPPFVGGSNSGTIKVGSDRLLDVILRTEGR